MAYVLDADTLIQAKDDYYAFDLCPGFWTWLDEQNTAGTVISIDKVREELEAGKDELTTWARERKGTFFLSIDAATHSSMASVSQWVAGGGFRDDAVRKFLSGADPFLIAFALAHGHSVATNEVHVEGQRNKVKIPTVCAGLNVPCVRTFDVLRELRGVFDLRR